MSNCMKLWGKTVPSGKGYPLIFHMLDCAAVAYEWLKHDSNLLSLFKRLASLEGDDDQIIDWFALIASLHDFGKATVMFQNKIPHLAEEVGIDESQWYKQRFDHGLYGHYWLNTQYNEYNDGEVFPDIEGDFKALLLNYKKSDLLKTTVGLWKSACWHHGRVGFDGVLSSQGESKRMNSYPLLVRLRSELLGDLASLLVGSEVFFKIIREPTSVIYRLFAGFVSVCDWIASSDEIFSGEFALGMSLESFFENTRGRATRALDRLGLIPVPMEKNYKGFNQLFCFGGPAREVQQKTEEVAGTIGKGGLVIIEAPTGEGKTEAALYCHYRSSSKGLYFALPTQATANQLYGRVVEFYKDSLKQELPITLAHGSAWLNEAYDAEKMARREWDDNSGYDSKNEWFFSRKKTILSPVAVGTVDQIMMAVLNVKHYFVKLFALAGKTLIIDEVHAYDAFMLPVLELLMCWCRDLNITVVLLSATLPRRMKRALVNAYLGDDLKQKESEESYPLITFAGDELYKFEVEKTRKSEEIYFRLFQHDGKISNVFSVIDSKVKSGGGNVLWFCNTVKRAQEVYYALGEYYKDEFPIYLFHSRFTMNDRAEIEKSVVELFGKSGDKRPYCSITVSTQVVEQSLDVDFDYIITDIAPIDLLLQRFGRMFRHERARPAGMSRPEALLLIPTGEMTAPVKSGKRWFAPSSLKGFSEVYDPLLIYRTMQALSTLEKIALPEQYRGLVEEVYDGGESKTLSMKGAVELTIAKEVFEAAEQYSGEMESKMRRLARQGLTHSPSLAPEEWQDNSPELFDEESGKAAFLLAKTRYSEAESIRVILFFREQDGYRMGESLFSSEELKGKMKDKAFQRELAGNCLSLSSPQKVVGQMKDGSLYPAESEVRKIEDMLNMLPFLKNHYLLMLDENGECHSDRWVLSYKSKVGLLIQEKLT